MNIPSQEDTQMQEESPPSSSVSPQVFQALLQKIAKNLDDFKKDQISPLLDEISTAISFQSIISQQDIEGTLKQSCITKFYECMNEVISKLLSTTKLQDEQIFVKTRETLQKLVLLFSNNMKQDNPIIRKCLVTLFNPESLFYSSEFDPPNRYFFSELIPDMKERRMWFESIKIGDLVDAVKVEDSYKKHCWSYAKVIEKSEQKVKLQFQCDFNKYDRWIEWCSYDLRKYKSRCQDFEWRQALKPNMIIDVCDTACVWYQSTILDCRTSVNEANQEQVKELYIGYRVYCDDGEFQDSQGRHYKGWTSKYDEWLSAHSPRIQKERKMSKKLFKQASQNNSEKIIDDSNDIIFEHEYYNVKKFVAIHRVQGIFKSVNSSYIQFINDFGDGFQKILSLIIQSNSLLLAQEDPNLEIKEPISFQALCDYVQIIYSVSPFFFKQFCTDFIPILNDSVQVNLNNSTEINIKSFKRELINDMIKHLGIILMRYFSIGQKIEILEVLEFKVAKMCFESSSVKQKTIGLQLLTQIVQKYQKNVKKSQQLNELKVEIEKNRYIQQLFNEDTHIQLLEKCAEFFIFLLEQNLFTQNDMKTLCKVIQKSHDDTRICYYNLLKQVSKSFKINHIKSFYEEINLKEDNKYKQYEIDILFEICFEDKYFQAERITLQNDIFNLIWDYINEFQEEYNINSELERQKMKLTVDKFCKLVRERKREQQVEQLREKLIENIKEGKNTYFSLEILESVMSQLNQYIDTQKKEFENLKKEFLASTEPTVNSQQPSENNAQIVVQGNVVSSVEANNNPQITEQIDNGSSLPAVVSVPAVVSASIPNTQNTQVLNVSDLYSEMENEINENNEIMQRLPHLMLPNAQYHQETQSYELPLSPSLRPQFPQQSASAEDSTANPTFQREKDKKEMQMQITKLQIKKKQLERKMKCDELRILVLDNLKLLKSKFKVEELEHSPQLIKSYISQIEKRINFLSFMNEECQIQVIDYELISQLLEELIEKQLVCAESEFFYRWLKRSNKKSKIIIPYVRQFFLEKVANDDNFITTLSLEGFDCFKSLFIQINNDHGNLVQVSEHPSFKNIIKDVHSGNKNRQNENIFDDTNVIFGDHRVDFLYLLNKVPSNLEGLQFLWKIAFLAKNEEVAQQGSVFLVNLFLKTTENLEDILVTIRNQFLDICFSNLKEKKYVVRTLQLIHTFIDFSELRGIGNLVAHSAELLLDSNSLIIKNQLPDSVNVMKIKNQFQLQWNYQKTLYELRVDLASIFKIGVDELLLLVPGKNDSYGQIKLLKDNLNGYTLQALEFSPNQVVLVQKQQKKWNYPVKLIKDDDQLSKKALEVIKEWFKAYSENGRMSMQNCAHFIESCTKDVCKVDDYRVIDVFKNWDSDKDGYLSEQDFLEFYRKGSKEKKETVMRNIQAHNYSDDLSRIYELRIHITQTEVDELPRSLLGHNEAIQKQIFELYDCKEEEKTEEKNKIRTLIEQLFNRLPTCPYIKTIIEDTNKIQDLLDQPSRYEFYYILECIENKFFEGYKEKEQGEINKDDIIGKLQATSNQSTNDLTDAQRQQEECNQHSNNNQINQDKQMKQTEVQTNQQVHQMSNENKIINVGLSNLLTSSDGQQRTDNQMITENYWIYNFFKNGLFERLLLKFDFLMQEWIAQTQKISSDKMEEENVGVETNKIQMEDHHQNSQNILESVQIKLLSKFLKLFNKFLSASLVEEHAYIFYLKQYMSTLYINIEDIDEDITKRSSPQTDQKESTNSTENTQINNQNNGAQTIGPQLPSEQNTFSVFGSNIQAPKIDKFQQIMNEYIKNNASVSNYLNKLILNNIPSIVIYSLLQTLRNFNKFSIPYKNLVIDSLYTLLLLLYKNQEQFVQEYQSSPLVYDLLKEGLFYQKNKLIRQIFSFFLFLLIRKLEDKQWMIEALIQLIPQYNQQDEQVETCSQFFSLLCLIFSKYGNGGFNFDATFQQVFETLKSIQSKESPISGQKDNLLNGYLQLTMTMLKNSKGISEKSEEEYVKYLIFSCLFHQSMIPQDENDKVMRAERTHSEIISEINEIKCFHFDSRLQCYKQISEICKQYPEHIPTSVIDNLIQITNGIKRQQKQVSFNPEANIKSCQGYVGLKNLGAICYMNSMIQQLFTCYPFVYSLLAADDNKEENTIQNTQGVAFDDNVLHQVQRLMTFLSSSIKRDYNPEGFCFSLKGYDGERTRTNLQQDTQEFLNLLVERVHNSLENTPFRNIFDTFFGVSTITERTCMKCNKKTQTEQPFYMIPIKIKGEKTLIGSIDKTFRQESIQDYKCDECKQVSEAQSQEYIKNLPNTLILNLFRISHNIETGQNQKDNTKITFEQNLNMYQFMYNTQSQMEIENVNMEDYQYSLKGIVVHNGTADYGHYFSFIKISDEKWLEFNDSTVTEYNSKEMANDCFGQDPSDSKIPKPYYESSKSAYLLFYEKVKKNSLEFIVKSKEEEQEVIRKLGIKNSSSMSFWKPPSSDQDCEEVQNPKKAKGSEFLLMVDYSDINMYQPERYKDQVSADNYQFICQKLILNNSFMSFVSEVVQTIPLPKFYADSLEVKQLKPYLPSQCLNGDQNQEILKQEIQIFSENYDYPKILKLIAYIYFNFITTVNDCSVVDSWFDLFYRFSSLCPQTVLEIFQEYIVDKLDYFWQDIIVTTNQKIRASTKQIVLHLLLIIIKSYSIDLSAVSSPPEENKEEDTITSTIMKFLANLFKGIHDQVQNNIYRCESYFEFLRDFAEADQSSAMFMIQQGMLEKLLDVFMGDESPLLNKYYSTKKVSINKNQVYNQFNPLLQTVYALLCKQTQLKYKQQKENNQNMQEPFSISNDLEKIIKSNSLYERAFSMRSDLNIIGRMVSHFSYKNYNYSYFIAGFIVDGINEKFRSDDITYYLELMSHFLTIFDELQIYRFEWILGFPQTKKNYIDEDFAFQMFLDDNYIEYISTLSPNIKNKEQTKGFLSQILDCNIGYANSREHYIVNKLLQLMDVNDNIFNYILTIPPPTYQVAYYIEFVQPYITKNQSSFIKDAYSTALLEQIEENYKSVRNKILNQEEQYKKISQELFSMSKNTIIVNQVPNAGVQEERQRIFETYIYGQTIQVNHLQQIDRIQNEEHLSCYTQEHEIYYCQNKLSVDGVNLVFPKEIISNDRVDTWKLNVQSNIFLLFNDKIKKNYEQFQELQQKHKLKDNIEECKQDTNKKSSSHNLRFSSDSSINSNKAIKSQQIQRNPISDELSIVLRKNREENNQIQQEDDKQNSQQAFPSQQSLTETLVNSSINLEKDKNNQEGDTNIVNEIEKDDTVFAHINEMKRDNLIREIIVNNSSESITYKLMLQVTPINQLSSFLLLSNFKYPGMIERILPPKTQTTMLTFTKSIPIHGWGDYELRFQVEKISDNANPNANQQNNQSEDIMDKLTIGDNNQKQLMLGPICGPYSNLNDKQLNEGESIYFVVCKYCTLQNPSNFTYCEVCNSPLYEDQPQPSPHLD